MATEPETASVKDANCWRCGRKLFESAAAAEVPDGVSIRLPCQRCHAMNHVLLRKLFGFTVHLDEDAPPGTISLASRTGA